MQGTHVFVAQTLHNTRPSVLDSCAFECYCCRHQRHSVQAPHVLGWAGRRRVRSVPTGSTSGCDNSVLGSWPRSALLLCSAQSSSSQPHLRTGLWLVVSTAFPASVLMSHLRREFPIGGARRPVTRSVRGRALDARPVDAFLPPRRASPSRRGFFHRRPLLSSCIALGVADSLPQHCGESWAIGGSVSRLDSYQ